MYILIKITVTFLESILSARPSDENIDNIDVYLAGRFM